MKKIALLVFIFLGINVHAEVADVNPADTYIRLRSYEPNTIVYRHDSNDVNYIDFKVSLMYPLWLGDHVLDPYFSVTGEVGQYLGTRDSSPVIGKRFNPKLFVRYDIKKGEYFDLGYAHESNGQSISTATDYLAKRAEFASHGEDPNFARDYISRGWDYVDVMWKRDFYDRDYSTYLEFKYFLNDGLLQGHPEEYQSWEGGHGHQRSEVDGISLLVKRNFFDKPFGISKVAVSETTGYGQPLTYNSAKAEITFSFSEIPPIIVWVSEGYNSDLVDYYKRVTSIGVGFELTTN